MGQETTTSAVWTCDACHERADVGGAMAKPDGWALLKHFQPEPPDLYEREMDLAWLLCPTCWVRARGALNALDEPDFWIWTDDPDEDQLESIGAAMKVQLTGAQLRSVIVKAAREGAMGQADIPSAFRDCAECGHTLNAHTMVQNAGGQCQARIDAAAGPRCLCPAFRDQPRPPT